MLKQPTMTNLVEVPNEGLTKLIGENVLIMCFNYFYTGKLTGINTTCILLENCRIVYETGAFTDANFKDAQLIAPEYYIQLSAIESFGKTDKI